MLLGGSLWEPPIGVLVRDMVGVATEANHSKELPDASKRSTAHDPRQASDRSSFAAQNQKGTSPVRGGLRTPRVGMMCCTKWATRKKAGGAGRSPKGSPEGYWKRTMEIDKPLRMLKLYSTLVMTASNRLEAARQEKLRLRCDSNLLKHCLI